MTLLEDRVSAIEKALAGLRAPAPSGDQALAFVEPNALAAALDLLFAGRIAVTLQAFGRALSVSVKHLYNERQRGRLRTIGTGRAIRIARSGAEAYVALLEKEGSPGKGASRRAPFIGGVHRTGRGVATTSDKRETQNPRGHLSVEAPCKTPLDDVSSQSDQLPSRPGRQKGPPHDP